MKKKQIYIMYTGHDEWIDTYGDDDYNPYEECEWRKTIGAFTSMENALNHAYKLLERDQFPTSELLKKCSIYVREDGDAYIEWEFKTPRNSHHSRDYYDIDAFEIIE